MTEFLASHQHVLWFASNVLRACLLLAVVTVVFAPLEHMFAVRPGRLFERGWSVNLGWYFFNGLFTTLLLTPPALLIAWLIHSTLPGAVTGMAAGLPLWARMVAAMVVGEIGFYWGHRWSHELPLLWRFHAVHHSAEHVNFSGQHARSSDRSGLHPPMRLDAALRDRPRVAGRSEPVAGADAGSFHRLAMELLHPR
jgi:sterol desaturase/sphingolipid hydroxylase (fatty acid hydroxylase superfamily)